MRTWRLSIPVLVYGAAVGIALFLSSQVSAEGEPARVKVCPIFEGKVVCPDESAKEEKPKGAVEADCTPGTVTVNTVSTDKETTVLRSESALATAAGDRCFDCFPVSQREGKLQQVCLEVNNNEKDRLRALQDACTTEGASAETCKKAFSDDQTKWHKGELRNGWSSTSPYKKTFAELGVDDTYSSNLYGAYQIEVATGRLESEIAEKERLVSQIDSELARYTEDECGKSVECKNLQKAKVGYERDIAERARAIEQMQDSLEQNPASVRRLEPTRGVDDSDTESKSLPEKTAPPKREESTFDEKKTSKISSPPQSDEERRQELWKRLQEEGDAKRAEIRRKYFSDSGDDLAKLFRALGGTQTNQCTAIQYERCVTPPHDYASCMACSQGGPIGQQNQSPIQQLIGNLARLFGNNNAVSQAMCGAYPGTQFINGSCQCSQGSQWMSNNAMPYGATPITPTVYQPYQPYLPYGYLAAYPNQYGSPYGYSGYPAYPTGSCQQVNVCAQYPGTQLTNNRCECPQGQQWTGSKCEVAAAPEPKAELSCSAKIVDEKTPLSISWSCTNASAVRADGFDPEEALTGSKRLSFEGNDPDGNPVPPFSLAVICIKDGKTATASCPIEINKPAIIASAVSSAVSPNATTSIGWIVKGMKEGEDVCTIKSNKHPSFSMTGRNRVVETPPIAENTTFTISCMTRGGNTKEAEVPITVKN